jgi:hypothetical protein
MIRDTYVRALCVAAALFAAGVHAAKIPEHLQIATWLGILFVIDVIGFVVIGVWLLVRPTRLADVSAALLGLGTAIGYVLSRTTGLPAVAKLPWDHLGIAVSVVEVLLALVAVMSIVRSRPSTMTTTEQRRAA